MSTFVITGNIYGEEIRIFSFEAEKMLAFNIFLDLHMISKMYKEDKKNYLSGNKDPKYQWNYTMTNLAPNERLNILGIIC